MEKCRIHSVEINQSIYFCMAGEDEVLELCGPPVVPWSPRGTSRTCDAIIEAAARALMIADVHLTQANAERVAVVFHIHH